MSGLKDRALKKCHTDKRKRIDEIHEELVSEMNEEELSTYYLDNGLLLDRYYSMAGEAPRAAKGIISLLNSDEPTEAPVSSTSRKDVATQYMYNVDRGGIAHKTEEYDRCKNEGCGKPMKMSILQGCLTCTECGYTEDIIVECEKGSYNDPPNESNYFAYKRINHFNEWLSQFQAKATNDIPDEVFLGVYGELKKDIYLDWENLPYATVRATLKKLGYNKYYENIPHIINVLSGKEAPSITREIEDVLRSLFKDIQEPFMKNCPSTRKNFLSYSYVLYKFCELLGYDNLLMYFPLLKSREKLQQQDIIWEKMCHDLKWQYIPST